MLQAISYYFEYFLCYKEAYILGVATGLLIAALMIKRKRKLASDTQ